MDWFNRINLPNKLTIIRILAIPVFVLFALNPGWMGGASKWIAAVLFVAASFTDMLDGKIARRDNLVTNFGKFMDPLADKLLVCTALICLLRIGALGAIPVIIIIAREFIISGFRLVAVESGIVIAANYWGKFKTVFQMIMVVMLLIDFGGIWHIIAVVVTWIAVLLTIISLVTYIRDNIGVITNGGF